MIFASKMFTYMTVALITIFAIFVTYLYEARKRFMKNKCMDDKRDCDNYRVEHKEGWYASPCNNNTQSFKLVPVDGEEIHVISNRHNVVDMTLLVEQNKNVVSSSDFKGYIHSVNNNSSSVNLEQLQDRKTVYFTNDNSVLSLVLTPSMVYKNGKLKFTLGTSSILPNTKYYAKVIVDSYARPKKI